jgi:photosystem II stability/assembly factor-like uncharacterized protein
MGILVMLLTVVTAVAFPGIAAAGTGWAQQASGTTANLHGVACTDSTHAWAVGDGGSILATVDGGDTWVAQASGTTAYLSDIKFADSLHGWAVGANGTILATTNGGTTWSSQTSGTDVMLRDLSVLDAQHVWAVGGSGIYDPGVILATSDAGHTWTPQANPSNNQLEGVAFSDAEHGIAVGFDQKLSTADGGVTWTGGLTGWRAVDVVMFPDGAGWVVGDELIGNFVDFGRTSFGEGTIANSHIEFTGVAAADKDTAWSVGGSYIYARTNGETASTVQPYSPSTLLTGVAFADARHGWVVGWDGLILHSTTGGWAPAAVSGFSPALASPGSIVTITGTGFTGATGIRFGGVLAQWGFTVDSDTQITAQLPQGAHSGQIEILLPHNNSALSTGSFTVLPWPAITGMSPNAGPPGIVVTLSGQGFTGTTEVWFDAVKAAGFTVVSDNVIRTTVPAGATTGPVKVVRPDSFNVSELSFTVTRPAQPPQITTLSPTSARRGATIVIRGRYFGKVRGTSKVKFGRLACQRYVSWSATCIRCKVPTGAKYGRLKVVVAIGGRTSNAKTVTVRR